MPQLPKSGESGEEKFGIQKKIFIAAG